jgi:WD40 repeat protein
MPTIARAFAAGVVTIALVIGTGCGSKPASDGATGDASGPKGKHPSEAPLSPRLSIETGIRSQSLKEVSSVAISADGRLAVAHGAGEKNNLQVWDLTKKEKVFETGNLCGGKNAVAISADGNLLAYAALSSVDVCKLPSGDRIPLGYLAANTRTVRFSRAGDLVVACNGETIVGWSTEPAPIEKGVIVVKPKFELKKAGEEIRETSDFFDEGRKIASNGKNSMVHIWDVTKGSIIREIKTGDHDRHVALEVSPDGKLLATNCLFDPIQIWDVNTGKLVKKITEKEGRDDALAFMPDSKGIIYTKDATIVIENLDTGAKKLLIGLNGDTWSLAVTADGKTVVAGDPKDATLKVWDIK